MRKIEGIQFKGKSLALIIRQVNDEKGVQFFTPDHYPLQVGKHNYSKAKVIVPHKHCPVTVKRKGSLHEVLFIEKGKVRITFYTSSAKKVASRIVATGDTILLMEGGHGFEFLSPTKMLEIKQGPFMPESKKKLEIKGKP